MRKSEWVPLFSDHEALKYHGAIDEIVEALRESKVSITDWGTPLLHAYLAVARQAPEHRTRAEELVDQAVQALSRQALPSSLYGGFAGVGWMVAHLQELFGHREDDLFEEVDTALLPACAPGRVVFSYDLINGPVGVGVYFLERLPHPSAVEGLARIVEELSRDAKWFGDSATWHTPRALVPPSQQAEAPNGYYNLGVAHGVTGIIALLGEMCGQNLCDAGAKALLSGAIRWVLKQQLRDGSFPGTIVDGVAPSSSRIAWCYGSLGLCVALLLATRALGDSELEQQALDIGLKAAERGDDSRILDACLCHGAAGNGHLFNRLFQATKREEFRHAAMSWFRRAIDMRVVGKGIAGFRNWKPIANGRPTNDPWHDDPHFLTGASGVALAFLAATSFVEPNWDRVLLARLEPCPAAPV